MGDLATVVARYIAFYEVYSGAAGRSIDLPGSLSANGYHGGWVLCATGVQFGI